MSHTVLYLQKRRRDSARTLSPGTKADEALRAKSPGGHATLGVRPVGALGRSPSRGSAAEEADAEKDRVMPRKRKRRARSRETGLGASRPPPNNAVPSRGALNLRAAASQLAALEVPRSDAETRPRCSRGEHPLGGSARAPLGPGDALAGCADADAAAPPGGPPRPRLCGQRPSPRSRWCPC